MKREKITWVGFKKSELQEVKAILDLVLMMKSPTPRMVGKAMILAIRIGNTLKAWDK